MRHSYGVAGYDDTYPLRSSKSLTPAAKDIRIPTIILTGFRGLGGGFSNRVFMSSLYVLSFPSLYPSSHLTHLLSYDAIILVHSQFFIHVEGELAKFSTTWRWVLEIYITFIRFIYCKTAPFFIICLPNYSLYLCKVDWARHGRTYKKGPQMDLDLFLCLQYSNSRALRSTRGEGVPAVFEHH